MTWQLDQVILPDDTYWANEIDDAGVAQAVSYSLTGAAIIEESQKQDGRQITLNLGTIQRSSLDALAALAATPAQSHSLELWDGRTWAVIFRRPDPFTVTPHADWTQADIQPGDWYDCTLNLLRLDGWN
jgi:hypothetical protein